MSNDFFYFLKFDSRWFSGLYLYVDQANWCVLIWGRHDLYSSKEKNISSSDEEPPYVLQSRINISSDENDMEMPPNYQRRGTYEVYMINGHINFI